MNDDKKYKLKQLSGADVRVKSLHDRIGTYRIKI